jgi:hypothetical protein
MHVSGFCPVIETAPARDAHDFHGLANQVGKAFSTVRFTSSIPVNKQP